MPAAATGPEHTPMWPPMWPEGDEVWQYDMRAAGGLPRHVGVDPVSLIDGWAGLSRAAVASAPQENDTALEVVRGTQAALHSMRRSISAGAPGAVFALTDGSAHGGGVQALATVASQEFPDDYYHSVKVLQIGGLVVNPQAARKGAAARELLRRISEWAMKTGHTSIVTPAGEAGGYYRSLGLEPEGAPWPRGALEGGLDSPGGPELDMVTLSSLV